MQPPGDGVGFSNLGFTLYRGGPLCQPTYNWEMLVPGVCRALVLIPADKYIREGSFQPGLKLNPGLVPTGLLPVWREHNKKTNRASTGVVRIRRIPAGLLPAWQERENCQPGFYRNDGIPTGLLPVWREEAARTANQPGFYRCDDGISLMAAPTGLLPVWAEVAGKFGSGFPDTVSRPA